MSQQGIEQEIPVNDAYLPALEDRSRWLILYGGSGSGKSVFAAQKIVLRAQCEEGHKFLCLRKVGETIKESIFAEIKTVLSEYGIYHEYDINKTEKTFTHRASGHQIICKGLDEPEKIKSIKGITGMWIEEATEFTVEELDQLNLRIRGEHKNYIQFICSFNPISEDHEVVKRFVTSSFPKASVYHTTHLDNDFLSQEDRDEIMALKDRNPLFYDIYCLGIPGKLDKTNKFFYSFKNEQVVKGLAIDPRLPLWIGMDFNIDPMTVTVAQRMDMDNVRCYKNIQLDNSDIYAMCDRIKADYSRYELIVTGDASGHNRTGIVRGKSSYWKVIKEELSLRDNQMKVRRQNIGLIESRVLCNAVNQNVKIIFDEEGCKQLVNDCKYGQVDEMGVLIKDRKKQKMDFLDTFRYLLDANFYDFLNRQYKYKRAA